MVALDFFKAFDTIKRAKIAEKLATFDLPDNVYNWFVNYLENYNHTTKYNNQLSEPAFINASVFQGSAVGPPLYVVTSSDLKPVNPSNFIDKYADN